MTPSALHRLIISIYGLSFPTAFFVAEAFGKADRFGSKAQTIMPMLIGLFGLAPFVGLFGWINRLGPRVSQVLLAIHMVLLVFILHPGTVHLAMLLPFPFFFAALYFPQREARYDYEEWLRAKKFVPAPNPSAAVLYKLDRRHRWQCYRNALALADGRTITLLLWTGISETSSMATMGDTSARIRTRHGLIAFSLAAREAGDGFIHEIETLSLGKITGWRRWKPADPTKHPYLAECLPDGTFVFAWALPHVAAVLEERLQMLRGLLENSSHLYTP